MKRSAPFSIGRKTLAMPPKAWGEEFEIMMGIGSVPERAPFTMQGSYAVVCIDGPLHQHAHWCQDSYEAIGERFALALASEAKEICLKINSPGGDFAGSLDLSRQLRSQADAAKKRIIAYSDNEALSAGYALAACADEIVISEAAFVGSIGVWAPLVDATAADAMMGVRWNIVASDERKADRNPHSPMSEEAINALQVQVNGQASLFRALVTELRSLSEEDIRSLKGAPVFGRRAVALGLADRTASWSEFLSATDRTSASQSKEEATMSKYDEALGAMRRAADGDDDDAKKAKKALKALDDSDKEDKKEDGEGEGEGEGKKGKASAKADAKADAEGEGEGEGKAKKAKAEFPPKEDEKEKKEASAQASSSFDFAARIHALEAERQAEKDSEKRAKLLAQRPDFSPEIVKASSSWPVAQLEEAVKTWPKLATAPMRPARAGQAMPTIRTDPTSLQQNGATAEEAEFIARNMGTFRKPAGGKLEIGLGDRAAAKAYLEQRAAQAKDGV